MMASNILSKQILPFLSFFLFCLFFLGCSPEILPKHVLLNGVSGELYSLSGDRHYLIFDEALPHLKPPFLQNAGYEYLPPKGRPDPTYPKYPGRFGVGVDRRSIADVYKKGSVYLIFADGRLTAEIVGIDPFDVLEDLNEKSTERDQP